MAEGKSEISRGAAVPVVVVNPASAGGATRRRWPEYQAKIQAALGEFEARFTERTGHATELSRAALRAGAKLVVAMGGDGTINEVVNGFFDEKTGEPIAPDAAFAVLPMGTGGDFIKTAKVSKVIGDAAQAIAAAAPRAIDVGRIDYVGNDGQPARRFFINITSIGIGGLVDKMVNDSSKVLGGKATFFIATMRASLSYRNPRLRLTLDDGAPREQAFYSVAVSNGRFFGGGMMIAPHAELDDGMFDVVTLGDIGMGTLVVHGTKVFRGEHLKMPWTQVSRARKVVAEPMDLGTPVLLDVDGEQPGRLPATFQILPGAIRLRA